MVEIEDLITHMRRVQAAERDMRDLSLTWQMIEASAAISCPQDVQSILPTLTQTRERFDGLQRRLVESLASESLAERSPPEKSSRIRVKAIPRMAIETNTSIRVKPRLSLFPFIGASSL